MILRDIAKTVGYRLFPQKMPAGVSLHLAYIFHTEALYDPKFYERMLAFLARYQTLTGKKALATLMSGAHPRVQAGLKKFKLSEAEFVERLKKIAEFSEVGYHGHYAFDPGRFEERSQQIRGDQFDIGLIEQQLDLELAWFRQNGIEVGPFYSAGWWFNAPELYALLAKKGFRLDASVSYSPWFRQEVTYKWFRGAGVRSAEPVVVAEKILAVQNLTGCHNTPYPDDFLRHLRGLLEGAPEESYAFVHSHDFDLCPDFTIRALEKIQAQGTKFYAASDFLAMATFARKINFPELSKSPA